LHLDKKILNCFIPDKKWFFDKKQFDSIHGCRHLLRVALWAMLFRKSKRSLVKVEIIIIAAVLHDIRRHNDRGDMGHGLRSARWVKKNFSIISKKFNIKFNADDIEEIYWLIYFHELPLDLIKLDKNYIKFKESVDIIRMADAIDRYRLPKLKWWIDQKKLGIRISDSIKCTAFNFIILSEEYFLKTGLSVDSIIKNIK